MITMRDLSGGDKLLLKDGQIIKVQDLRGDYIMVSSVEWYHISEVVKIIDKYKVGKSW